MLVPQCMISLDESIQAYCAGGSRSPALYSSPHFLTIWKSFCPASNSHGQHHVLFYEGTGPLTVPKHGSRISQPVINIAARCNGRQLVIWIDKDRIWSKTEFCGASLLILTLPYDMLKKSNQINQVICRAVRNSTPGTMLSQTSSVCCAWLSHRRITDLNGSSAIRSCISLSRIR